MVKRVIRKMEHASMAVNQIIKVLYVKVMFETVALNDLRFEKIYIIIRCIYVL